MNASKTTISRFNNVGGTLIEALLVLGVITTLATLAYTIISAALPTSADSKLSRQLAVLNASSTMYRINGGHIPAFSTSSQVLAKLQSASIDAEADQVVGLAGSMVDPQLVGIPTNEEETADESLARVIWSTELNKFLVSHEPVAGIKSFVLKTKDADQIVVAKESRLRGGAVRYAATDDWVWDFDETPITNGSPDYIPDPGVWGGGPGSLPGPTTGVLDPPMISTPGGTYPIDQYPLQVTLGDPNTPGTSALYYSINNNGQTLYTGETLAVNHSDFISAICEPVDDDWQRSGFTTAYYDAAAIQLETPFIRASAPQFDYLTDTTVYVTLDNPNDASVSDVEYRIDGGAWESYADHSIQLTQLLYPDGATIEARALPTADYYTASNIASRTVDPGVVTDLNPPIIAFSDPAFGPGVDRIGATLSNPNSPGSSDVYYAIADPEAFRDESLNLRFRKYREFTTQITAHQQSYPNGFAIVAYARAKTPAFHDSIFAEDEVGNGVTPDLADGHIDVETSSFIAAFHNGTVDGHLHGYNLKAEVPGIDYFNLHGRSLHDLTDDVPADAKFKVIVANPDLSPGGRLVINGSYDDTDPATWINVQDYADIPLADLPVFSLDGAAGTTQLTALALYFEPTAFENGEIIPTNPEDVRSNVPGKNGEWRNGALTIQAVSVAADNTDQFTTSTAISAGGLHGAATTGLFWESTLYWHWDGPSYHDPENTHGFTPLFTGNAGGEFFDPTGQENMVTNLGRSNYFEWGTPVAGDKGSNITFLGYTFDEIGIDELFALGIMEFQNNTITSGTDAHTVKFDLNLELDIPQLTETLEFSFDLFSTVNSTEQTEDENADYFTFGNFNSDFAASVNGQLYGLELQFGEVDANGFSTIHQFHTHEDKTATGTLYGSFYAVDLLDPIP